MNTDNPILNNQYHEPLLHYATVATGEEEGALDYSKIIDGRRIFYPNSEGAIPSTIKNLMIEISRMSKDKVEKKWFVVNRWIPAVNA